MATLCQSCQKAGAQYIESESNVQFCGKQCQQMYHWIGGPLRDWMNNTIQFNPDSLTLILSKMDLLDRLRFLDALVADATGE